MWAKVRKGLQHERLSVRIGWSLLVGYLLLFAGWVAGYGLLQEGALRGALSGGAPLESPDQLGLFLRLGGYNLGLPGLLLYGFSRLKVGGYSLGYNIPFLNALLYGLWLGSNSFAVPMPERMAPSLAVFWQRSGPWEMAAFMLMAAALARSAAFAQASFWHGPTVRLPKSEAELRTGEWLCLAGAILLLAAANWIEAQMLLARLAKG